MRHGSNYVYFHGVPGSPSELNLFGGHAFDCVHPIFAPDRNMYRVDLDMPSCLDELADEIRQRFSGLKINLIAFSLGAKAALEVADRLGAQVNHIDLISPAAPLQSGNFLPYMAGGQVFGLAMRSRSLFGALVRVQSMFAAIAPDHLISRIFSNATAADLELSRRPEFRGTMEHILRDTFRNGAVNYRREVAAYVRPWGDFLKRIQPPVALWHGEDDNWAPVGMSSALMAALPNVDRLRRFSGLSHYSTLDVALREIAARTRQLAG